MAFDETLEGWGAVFGQVQGQLDSKNDARDGSGSMQDEFRPSLFCLHAEDDYHLRLCVSDFHSQTWQGDFSVPQLQDLREDVGIGKSLGDFLAYLRSAFSSTNVRLLLGGPDRSVGGTKSGRMVAQKVRGTPFVSLPLERLGGSAADDAKGSIALGNFRAYLALSSSLDSEKAQIDMLNTSLTAEKAKTERLQEQIDASNFKSRGKLKRAHSSQSGSASQQYSLLSSQYVSQEALPSVPASAWGISKDGKEEAGPKAPGITRRVNVAPPSRRVKQRGTVIRESKDS